VIQAALTVACSSTVSTTVVRLLLPYIVTERAWMTR
jgi:hypothetical protein